ncbi:MAG: nuclear transport factor 2 family protein [Paracoccaceae bacterium]
MDLRDQNNPNDSVPKLTNEPAQANALTIADDLLERTGRAMASNDFPGFLQCFTVPMVMETFDGKTLIQTERVLEGLFQSVVAFRAAQSIVDVVRENVAAEFIDFETIATTHVSRMMQSRNRPFGRPFPAYSVIKRIDGTWRIQFCQYALDDLPQFNDILLARKKETPRTSAAFLDED